MEYTSEMYLVTTFARCSSLCKYIAVLFKKLIRPGRRKKVMDIRMQSTLLYNYNNEAIYLADMFLSLTKVIHSFEL